MIFTEIAFALVAAVLCAAIVIATVGWDPYASGGWPTALLVFALLFLTIWAGAVWLTPLGMQLWGAEWIPFLAVAFIVSLFLAALAPRHPARSPEQATEQAEAREVAKTTVNVFFWVLLAVLVAALAIHYGGAIALRQ